MKTIDLSQLDLHDATILGIDLKSNDGFLNNIVVDLRLAAGDRIKLSFVDCFSSALNLNQWIENCESIYSWSFDMTSEQHKKIKQYEIWSGIKLEGQFEFFSMTTNTTNSHIDIIAKSIIGSQYLRG